MHTLSLTHTFTLPTINKIHISLTTDLINIFLIILSLSVTYHFSFPPPHTNKQACNSHHWTNKHHLPSFSFALSLMLIYVFMCKCIFLLFLAHPYTHAVVPSSVIQHKHLCIRPSTKTLFQPSLCSPTAIITLTKLLLYTALLLSLH